MLVIQANGVQNPGNILGELRGIRNPEKDSPHEMNFYKLKQYCLFYWHSFRKTLMKMFVEFEVYKMKSWIVFYNILPK